MIFENEATFKSVIKEFGLNLFLGAGFSVESRNKYDENLFVVNKLIPDICKYFDIEKLKVNH